MGTVDERVVFLVSCLSHGAGMSDGVTEIVMTATQHNSGILKAPINT